MLVDVGGGALSKEPGVRLERVESRGPWSSWSRDGDMDARLRGVGI